MHYSLGGITADLGVCGVGGGGNYGVLGGIAHFQNINKQSENFYGVSNPPQLLKSSLLAKRKLLTFSLGIQ